MAGLGALLSGGASASSKAAGSCFYTPTGKRQWCAGPGTGGEWDPAACAIVTRGSNGWLYATEGHSPLGYARPVGRGRWNVSAPGGRDLYGTVLQRSSNRFDIYKRGRLVGYTTRPHPAVVGLFRLAANACFS